MGGTKSERKQTRLASDILVDSMAITDMRPLHISVVCVFALVSNLEPDMFGK